jgi:hypothetical protein
MTELTRYQKAEQVKDNIAEAIVAFAKSVGAFSGEAVNVYGGAAEFAKGTGAAWETDAEIFIPWLKSPEIRSRLTKSDVVLWEAKDGSFRLVDADPLAARPEYVAPTSKIGVKCCFCSLGDSHDEVESTVGMTDALGPVTHPYCRDHYGPWIRHVKAYNKAFGHRKTSAA